MELVNFGHQRLLLSIEATNRESRPGSEREMQAQHGRSSRFTLPNGPSAQIALPEPHAGMSAGTAPTRRGRAHRSPTVALAVSARATPDRRGRIYPPRSRSPEPRHHAGRVRPARPRPLGDRGWAYVFEDEQAADERAQAPLDCHASKTAWQNHPGRGVI